MKWTEDQMRRGMEWKSVEAAEGVAAVDLQ